MKSLSVRFWSKVRAGESCWIWTAATNSRGYGQISVGHSRSRLAHRVSYEMAFGAIPDGLQIDHLCRERRCVRPSHLEVVTAAENVRRAPPNHGGPRRVCDRGHAGVTWDLTRGWACNSCTWTERRVLAPSP